jgi:hypothetical protein
LRPILFAVFVFALTCSSQVINGVDQRAGTTLLKQCRELLNVLDHKRQSDSDFTDAEYCSGYARGFVDGIAVANGTTGTICVPPAVTTEEIVRVVEKYMDDHPEDLHENRAYLMTSALLKAYPCKKRE